MAGFYGKLPGKGDFLTRNLPRQFVDVWDDWLQSGMNAAKQVLGDEWLQVYLTSPLWRFVLPPGICGESAWAGVMMPSMDRVGRYFPMTVAVELTLPVSPVMVAVSCDAWFESVENSLLEALDNEALDIDLLAGELESNQIDQQAAQASAFDLAGVDRGVRSPLGEDLNIAGALLGVTVGMLDDALASSGVWWGRGVWCMTAISSQREPGQQSRAFRRRQAGSGRPVIKFSLFSLFWSSVHEADHRRHQTLQA